MDRLGRSMMDLAPHVAMMGSDFIDAISFLNSNNLSTTTLNGSTNSVNNLGIFNRFNRNSNSYTFTPTNLNSNYFSQINPTNPDQRNGLVSLTPLVFQIPVILNPGEILSIGSSSDPFVGECNVDLHIHAVVKKPKIQWKHQGNQTIGKEDKIRKRKNTQERLIDEFDEDLFL